jgi:hypothetical protein
MKKQITIICMIGMLLAVGLSGCLEEEPKISNTIKIQVLVVFKYLNNESYWEWNNKSYIIVVHEDEYFGVPDDSIIVSNKTYCNVSDGKQMFKLMRIINGSNVIIEFNESVFYNYTLHIDMSHYNPAKDPSWDIIKIYIENPLNLSTQKRVLYPIRGNMPYLDWGGEPNYNVKVYLKIIDESEKNKETDFSNAYGAINGTAFRSIRMLSGGLGPNGPVFRYWVISFHNETYSWEFSDIVEAGIYECDGWNITGYSVFHDGKYFGYYNNEKGILLWGGEEYIKVTENEENERLIKNLILENISNFENTDEANITFTNISVSENNADVDILIVWGPELCVGYQYKLIYSDKSWEIESKKRTIIC